MKYTLLIALVLSYIFVSCSSETPEKSDSKSQNMHTQIEEPSYDIVANRLLKMDLEGMVCQMGCGGAIRKELNATGAVANCDFNFEEGRAVDVATISFDENKISSEKIVQIVSEINDGQFDVGAVSSEAIAEVDSKY